MLDHHQPYVPEDAAGGETPSLLSRILRIAEDYDLLVGTRDASRRVPPAMALPALWAGRGGEYDPILLALFAQALGRFPAGSLLELSDGRWGLTVSGGRDREHFKSPMRYVRIVREADGRVLDPVEEIDLHLSKTVLNPRRILDPGRLGFDLEDAIEKAFAPS